MAKERDIKPCPFCPEAIDLRALEFHRTDWHVFCCTCGTRGPTGLTQQEAIQFWNKRDGESIPTTTVSAH